MNPHRKDKLVDACRKAWEEAGRGKMLLAVSGGADSTALLLAFHFAGIPFEVAHCNFNLRSEESIRDREFVKCLCEDFGLVLHIAEFDVPRQAMRGESTEMTCRRLRYDFFKRLREENGFTRTVVAHNSDDNIETFFLNALRGSGSKGLMGMVPDNGEILRPLLPFGREEILAFLKLHNQEYVTDSSNLTSRDYRRNFLRNEVFPLLSSQWEGFSKALSSTIAFQRRENRIVSHFISRALEGCDRLLPWATTDSFPDSETLIFSFIKPYGGTTVIAEEMAAAALARCRGKKWRLADGLEAVFTREGILIEETLSEENPWQAPSYSWDRLEGADLDFGKVKSAPLTEIYLPFGEDNYEWKRTDREMKIKSLGLKGSQPVMKVLKDYGLTATQRNSYPVLTDRKSGEPVWIPGIKRSRLHLISPTDKVAYRVH